MFRFAGSSKARSHTLANAAVSTDKDVRFLKKLRFFHQGTNEKRVSHSRADCVKLCSSRRQSHLRLRTTVRRQRHRRLRTTVRKDVGSKNKKRNTGSRPAGFMTPGPLLSIKTWMSRPLCCGESEIVGRSCCVKCFVPARKRRRCSTLHSCSEVGAEEVSSFTENMMSGLALESHESCPTARRYRLWSLALKGCASGLLTKCPCQERRLACKYSCYKAATCVDVVRLHVELTRVSGPPDFTTKESDGLSCGQSTSQLSRASPSGGKSFWRSRPQASMSGFEPKNITSSTYAKT